MGQASSTSPSIHLALTRLLASELMRVEDITKGITLFGLKLRVLGVFCAGAKETHRDASFLWRGQDFPKPL
jgi:hypothetical protein